MTLVAITKTYPAQDVEQLADLGVTEVGENKDQEARAKARAVLALLNAAYGEPAWPVLDPLATLIEVILSHRTADPQTWAAYQALRARWPTWEALRDAPVAEIEDAFLVLSEGAGS